MFISDDISPLWRPEEEPKEKKSPLEKKIRKRKITTVKYSNILYSKYGQNSKRRIK